MDDSIWRAGRRLAVLAGGFGAVTYAMATSAQEPLVLAAQGRVKFFLGAAAFGAVMPRIGRALVSDHVSATDIHTGTVTCGLLAVIMAAMSAVTAQTAAHALAPTDIAARVVFDNLYILLCMGMLVTAVPSDPRDIWDKWVRIGKVVMIVAALMLALSYADALPAWIGSRHDPHDFAPTGPDTDGRP
jgi:hypothetical protein